MRSFIGQIVMLSLLFLSVDGAIDATMDEIPHGDDVAHESEFGHPLEDHGGNSPDSELNGEHCEHCCHGHGSTLASQISSSFALGMIDDRRVDNPSHIRNFAQAPPTPPPNA